LPGLLAAIHANRSLLLPLSAAVKGGVDGTRIDCRGMLNQHHCDACHNPDLSGREDAQRYVLAVLGVRRSVGLTFGSKGEGHTAATLEAPPLITSLRVL